MNPVFIILGMAIGVPLISILLDEAVHAICEKVTKNPKKRKQFV